MTTTIEKTQVIDKQALKAAILELIVEDKEFALQISKLVEEASNPVTIDIDDEDLEFDAIARRNFERYDKTFKALA